jgi:hypothetical protein
VKVLAIVVFIAVIILVGDCGGMGVVVAWWLQWHGGCGGMVVVAAW